MSIDSSNDNKYLTTFIHDCMSLCWDYLLKKNHEAFEKFKISHLWIENETQSHIALFIHTMENNTLLMHFIGMFFNMGLCVKPMFEIILNIMV